MPSGSPIDFAVDRLKRDWNKAILSLAIERFAGAQREESLRQRDDLEGKLRFPPDAHPIPDITRGFAPKEAIQYLEDREIEFDRDNIYQELGKLVDDGLLRKPDDLYELNPGFVGVLSWGNIMKRLSALDEKAVHVVTADVTTSAEERVETNHVPIISLCPDSSDEGSRKAVHDPKVEEAVLKAYKEIRQALESSQEYDVNQLDVVLSFGAEPAWTTVSEGPEFTTDSGDSDR